MEGEGVEGGGSGGGGEKGELKMYLKLIIISEFFAARGMTGVAVCFRELLIKLCHNLLDKNNILLL